MTMYDGDLLSDEYVPEEREERVEGGKNDLIVEHREGQVVDLQAVGHVTDTLSA